jgi:uncharacterized membrane protein YbaN (DUF454 family)
MIPGRAKSDSNVQIRAAKGRIRIEAQSLFADQSDTYLETLINRLIRLPAVQSIDVDRRRRAVVIGYDAALLRVDAALRSFSDALRAPMVASRLAPVLPRSLRSYRDVDRLRIRVGEGFDIGAEKSIETGSNPPRIRRLFNLTLGTACFGMSVVGIMAPFVPTMPFVLATGYFLANSSPTLHGLFRRSPLFGEMLCDWEECGGWRMTTKLKLFALMAFLWCVTLAIAGFSWPLVIMMGLMSGISILTIVRVPTIADARPVMSPS